MDNTDLKPFYAYLDSRADQRIQSFFTQVDTLYLGVLVDKEKRLARIKKTFSYLTEDTVQYMDKEVEITFDSYFIPSPLDFEIIDNMQGLVLFLKEKQPNQGSQIEINYKCVFLPTGILTEAFLQGKNNKFGLRKELYKSMNDLSQVVEKITTIITSLVIPVVQGSPVLDPVTGTQITTELNNIKTDLQSSIQNLEE